MNQAETRNAETTPSRCPLCFKPLTKLDALPPLGPGATCLDCNIYSTEPFADWYPFDEDKEQ